MFGAAKGLRSMSIKNDQLNDGDIPVIHTTSAELNTERFWELIEITAAASTEKEQTSSKQSR